MSEYKGGYRSETPRYQIISLERKEFEKYIKTRDLVDLAGKIERGEPHEVNPAYGGRGYTYLFPETDDLGRLKVTLIDNKWNLKWEDKRGSI